MKLETEFIQFYYQCRIKIETEYLGMSKLFEYPIKSYLKNLTLCGMP